MSYALQLLFKSTGLTSITQRFCEPGHSAITDVDNLHSVIEQSFSQKIMFPVSLVRHLKVMRASSSKTHVHMMKATEFFDFKPQAEGNNYSKVKYGSTKELFYHKVSVTKVSFATEMRGNQNSISVIHQRCNQFGLSIARLIPSRVWVQEMSHRTNRTCNLCYVIIMTGDDLAYMKGVVDFK